MIQLLYCQCKGTFSTMFFVRYHSYLLVTEILVSSGGATGGTWGDLSPQIQKIGKNCQRNWHKLVRYTFRLKNYVKIHPFHSDFSELSPPQPASFSVGGEIGWGNLYQR